MSFCMNCGNQLPDGSRFCGNCGAQQGAATAAPMQQPAQPVLSPNQMEKNGVIFTRADVIDYQIFGDDMQLVEIELDPGESVLAEAGAMNYMDARIKMETIFGDGSGADANKGFGSKLLSAGKRALTGEGLFMTVFQNVHPAEKAIVAFASPYPGKIIPVDLDTFDRTLICQKSAFLCAAKGVNVGIHLQKKLGAGLFGGEGFIMQRLTGDGIVFLNAGGTIIKKTLQAGEMLKIDTGCLVAMSETVDYDVAFQSDIKSGFLGGEGLFLATLTGPGEVWLQSLPFSRMADEIIKASRSNKEENKGINNPISEVTGGLGGALGGLLKF
ncbi:MAG: TIGR00266 family protein [Oscillospiraceae bacterium]|nr:TIGR00266 family protein [Oscillospiraceae bacterium]